MKRKKKKVVSKRKNPDKQVLSRTKKKTSKKKLSKKKKKRSKIARDSQGRWPKGTSGNAKGRPAGTSATDYALNALRKVERETGKNLLEHLFKQALKDNKVLPKAVSFVVPTLKSVAVSGIDEGGMSDEEAKEIQDELRSRVPT